VPDRFTFRFDRRLTVGETPEQAVADIDRARRRARAARAAGLKVEVDVPTLRPGHLARLRAGTTRRSTWAG
jgi:acetylornithine deacetylase/succinyl-diaminopimelate desuccinylase-like protein